jgi:hypothetical protein
MSKRSRKRKSRRLPPLLTRLIWAASQTEHLFSYISPEDRVPPGHPLRAIRAMTDAALRELSPQFERLYAAIGRPSVPPEKLLRAL